ncbi:MAG: FAD-binding protein, partial [Cytophagales bacterium]|nr:FAD-binding protein [Cytophagales bacterium]
MKENYSLKHLNTFGLDAKAKRFLEIDSVEKLKKLLKEKEIQEQEKLVLGGGSNLLFTQDYDGLVIKNNIGGIRETVQTSCEVYVTAGAGVVWHDLVLWAVERGYGGIENLSLIPGTVGAAPIQNIGAYGVELKDVFVG